MTDPNPLPRPLPAIVATFLALPGGSGQGSWVRAQVVNFANAETSDSATDTLYCALLLGMWELSVCADGSHAELFCRDAGATFTLPGDWPRALRDLRVLFADPRFELLLNLSTDHAA
jgi:hypothetical protein